MKMRSCRGWVVVLLAWLCFVPLARGAGKPNILFLFADDQRADTIAALGNSHIKTPNIDRLVNAGFTFRTNYCFGGNSGAVCVPSRAMLMSGKTWFHVDTATLKDAKLFPEVLQEKLVRLTEEALLENPIGGSAEPEECQGGDGEVPRQQPEAEPRQGLFHGPKR